MTDAKIKSNLVSLWYFEYIARVREKGSEIMWAILDKISYNVLIPVAVLMLLAPFRPMPHALEKLIMLRNGELTSPIDIFDLLFHLLPTLILLIKIYRSLSE
jgi:hypothetical protein